MRRSTQPSAKVRDAALQCVVEYRLNDEDSLTIDEFLRGLRCHSGWTRSEVDEVARHVIHLLEVMHTRQRRRRKVWFEGPYIRTQWWSEEARRPEDARGSGK